MAELTEASSMGQARLRVLKWSVPVDGQPWEIGAGQVLHVACQQGADSVQVWTLETDIRTRWVQVFGTGRLLPGNVSAHLGSALWGSTIVWHVFEVVV